MSAAWLDAPFKWAGTRALAPSAPADGAIDDAAPAPAPVTLLSAAGGAEDTSLVTDDADGWITMDTNEPLLLAKVVRPGLMHRVSIIPCKQTGARHA